MNQEQIAQKTKEDLINQKNAIEDNLRFIERRDIEEKLRNLAPAIRDLSHSITNIQNNLNLVWKRTEQIQTEIKEILNNANSNHPA